MPIQSPLQAGRGAFMPPGEHPSWMKHLLPQKTVAKPKDFLAEANKMWKPPAHAASPPPKVPEAPKLARAKRALMGNANPAAPQPIMRPPVPPSPRPAPAPAAAPRPPAGAGANSFLAPFHGFMQQNPAAAGMLLASAPQFTRGLTQYTGGLGLMGLANLLMNGGRDIARFFPSSQTPPSA